MTSTAHEHELDDVDGTLLDGWHDDDDKAPDAPDASALPPDAQASKASFLPPGTSTDTAGDVAARVVAKGLSSLLLILNLPFPVSSLLLLSLSLSLSSSSSLSSSLSLLSFAESVLGLRI